MDCVHTNVICDNAESQPSQKKNARMYEARILGRLVASCPSILPFSSQQEHCVRSTPKRYQPNLIQCLEPLPWANADPMEMTRKTWQHQ